MNLRRILPIPLFVSAAFGATPSSPPGSSAPQPAETVANAGVAPAPAPKKEKSEWVFSLLPKAFQKNPRVDLTVITEMTPPGRQLPPVSAAKPAYYISQSAGSTGARA